MSVFPSGPLASTFRTIFRYVAGSCRIAIFMGAGDIIIQHYNSTKGAKELNYQRTAKFALIGFCFMGPILTYWKNIVNKTITVNQNHISRILQQLFCDQIFLAPCLNLGLITMWGMLENQDVNKIEQCISEYFPFILKRHYMLWPAVQFFGIMCIKPSLQISFANFIAILWFAYLSGILHKDKILEKSSSVKKCM